MSFVLDASVALKLAVREEGSEAALALVSAARSLTAPQFVRVETANVLWKKVRRGELDEAQARAATALIERSFPEFVDDAELLTRAFALAVELGHPIYDCLYLACAERVGRPLVTADRRFFEKTTASRYRGMVQLLAHSTQSGSA
ncbi:MAG: hypothetical protein DI629_17065 [Mesorhizobium amorphae]|nr:MAG: hypothetical protein DI629_17065 [Mesorhizobium amorphae]